MGAAPTARTLPDLRLRLLKAAVVIPDLIISSLIGFVILAALPADVAVGFIASVLAISIVVASGRAEGLVVRTLHAARPPWFMRRGESPGRCGWSLTGLASMTSAC